MLVICFSDKFVKKMKCVGKCKITCACLNTDSLFVDDFNLLSNS